MNFINNENGTYTIRWEEYSNGKDLTSWGGKETGKIKEVTISPDELCYIEIDRNTIYFTNDFICNICPSDVIAIAVKFKELLPNLLEVQSDIFEDRKVGDYRINPNNILFYLKGTAFAPDKMGLLKMGTILFRGSANVLLLPELDCVYFEKVYLPFRKANIIKIKEKLNDIKN